MEVYLLKMMPWDVDDVVVDVESLHIFLVVEGVGRMVCAQGGVDDA